MAKETKTTTTKGKRGRNIGAKRSGTRKTRRTISNRKGNRLWENDGEDDDDDNNDEYKNKKTSRKRRRRRRSGRRRWRRRSLRRRRS